jgi:hypothetical protein
VASRAEVPVEVARAQPEGPPDHHVHLQQVVLVLVLLNLLLPCLMEWVRFGPSELAGLSGLSLSAAHWFLRLIPTIAVIVLSGTGLVLARSRQSRLLFLATALLGLLSPVSIAFFTRAWASLSTLAG